MPWHLIESLTLSRTAKFLRKSSSRLPISLFCEIKHEKQRPSPLSKTCSYWGVLLHDGDGMVEDLKAHASASPSSYRHDQFDERVQEQAVAALKWSVTWKTFSIRGNNSCGWMEPSRFLSEFDRFCYWVCIFLACYQFGDWLRCIPSSIILSVQLEIRFPLQSDIELKSRATSYPKGGFWHLLLEQKCPNLRRRASNLTALFGSTYSCEAAFSHMKIIKSRYRSPVTDDPPWGLSETCNQLLLPWLWQN